MDIGKPQRVINVTPLEIPVEAIGSDEVPATGDAAQAVDPVEEHPAVPPVRSHRPVRAVDKGHITE